MVGSVTHQEQSATTGTAQVPKAYLIAEVEVGDAAAYEKYKSAVVPIVAQFGGRYIVRGGRIECVEGPASSGRVVVIEFSNMTDAQDFLRSDEYRPIAAIRHQNAISRIMIVEGVLP